LFVVSRLAARLGIKIMLRRSPYDGTTAIVLLPSALLAGAEAPAVTAPQRSPRPADHPARQGRPVRALGAAQPGLDEGTPDTPEVATWFEANPAPRPRQANGIGPVNGPAPGNGSTAEPDAAPVPRQAHGAAKPPAPDVEWSVTVPPQETTEDLDGLPMRIPQTSMAPQLRATRRVEPRAVSVRSPEEHAQLMSSMQRGWQQGRHQAEQGQDVWNRKDDHPDARPQK
jgi:hypothetical protein